MRCHGRHQISLQLLLSDADDAAAAAAGSRWTDGRSWEAHPMLRTIGFTSSRSQPVGLRSTVFRMLALAVAIPGRRHDRADIWWERAMRAIFVSLAIVAASAKPSMAGARAASRGCAAKEAPGPACLLACKALPALPKGNLFWHLDRFPSKDAAEHAAAAARARSA